MFHRSCVIFIKKYIFTKLLDNYIELVNVYVVIYCTKYMIKVINAIQIETSRRIYMLPQ